MSILKIKDSQSNWVGVPTVKGDTGNGISSAVLNDDYTLTLTFTDGTTYTTPSIRGEKGEQGEPATDMEIHICSITEYDNETRIPTIANPNDKTFYLVPTEDGTSPDLFTEWVYVNNAWEMFGSMKIDLSGYLTDVQINGTSIVEDGVANVPYANPNNAGVIKTSPTYGVYNGASGVLLTNLATSTQTKAGTNTYRPIVPYNQHESVFYGLAKASGDTTQASSSNAVGTYTDTAKSKIQDMIGIDDWQLVAEETLSEDGGFDITIANSAREVYIYAEIEIASSTTSLVVEAYSDSGTRAYYQTFGSQINSSKKAITVVQLIPIATEIKALAYFGKDVYTNSGHFDWQHKEFNVGKLNRFRITAYGDSITIPTGSIVRIFAR